MARDKLKITILQEKEGVYENVDIDLFDFLENSSKSEPILVVSDIHLPKGKKRPLPNFSKVYSDAKIFNSGDWRITPDSVLPNGISELICLHSISSIGDLIGVLPHCTGIVRVRNSILTSVMKTDKEFELAQKFIQQHPGVSVIDERGNTLAQITSEKLDLKNEKTSVAPKQDTAEIIRLPVKTPDWICAEDFVKYVKENNILTQLSKEELKRYFQQARSAKARLNLESCQMWLADDVWVSCVKAKDIDKIVQYIQQQEAAKATPKKTEEKTPVKKTTKTTVNTETSTQETPQTCCLKEKTVEKTEIKKYFTKKVKKQIPKNAMLDVLKTIKKVNINPGATKGENVFYIDDNGDMCSLPTLEFKTAKCLCQALPNNNAARIVWALKGDIMVAINFFKNHGGDKEANVYKQYIRNITDKDVPNIDECISVEDLIKEMYDGGDGPDTDGADDALKTSKKEHKKVAETKSENVFVLKKEETAKKETTDVAPVLTEEKKLTKDVASDAVEMVKTVVPKNTNTDEKEAIDSSDAEFTKMPTWVDVASIASKIIQEYELTSKKITRVERGISETQDVKKKFKLATVLVDLLGQQVNLKEKMQELERINKTLEDFLADFNKCRI